MSSYICLLFVFFKICKQNPDLYLSTNQLQSQPCSYIFPAFRRDSETRFAAARERKAGRRRLFLRLPLPLQGFLNSPGHGGSRNSLSDGMQTPHHQLYAEDRAGRRYRQKKPDEDYQVSCECVHNWIF